MVMVKSSTANVIDLESFRERRKAQREGRPVVVASSMMMPIWFCWIPMWSPFVG